jgi:hypothetical protein
MEQNARCAYRPVRGDSAKLTQTKDKVRTMPKSFHSVSIAARPDSACPAVVELAGKRFLSTSAPSIPLAGCSHPKTCKCVYRHHKDRREDPRRDSDSGLAGRPYYATERRVRPGRRAGDVKHGRSMR